MKNNKNNKKKPKRKYRRRPTSLVILHSKAIQLVDSAYTAGFEAAKQKILGSLQPKTKT